MRYANHLDVLFLLGLLKFLHLMAYTFMFFKILHSKYFLRVPIIIIVYTRHNTVELLNLNVN